MDKELRKGQFAPAGLVNEISDQAEAANEQAGYGMIKYPGGSQFLPPDIEEIWIQTVGRGSSSSSDVSSAQSSSQFIPNSAPGSGASDPGSSSTTSASGSTSSASSGSIKDNRYAWNQTMVVIDSNGIETHIIDPSGLSGTQDSNPAVEVNNRTDVPEGFICRAYLSPSKNAWHFTYPGLPTSSSGLLRMVVDCAAGTITIGGTTSSSDNSSTKTGTGTTTKPQGGIGSGGGGDTGGGGAVPK